MQNLCVDKVPSHEPNQNQVSSGPLQVQWGGRRVGCSFANSAQNKLIKDHPHTTSCLHPSIFVILQTTLGSSFLFVQQEVWDIICNGNCASQRSLK